MDIDHILALARLKIREKEKRELEKEFSAILNFIKKLQELNVKDISFGSHLIESKSVLREDIVSRKQKDEKETKKLLDSSPATKDRHIKVKQVLES